MLNLLQMMAGALLQIVAFVVVFFVGTVALVALGGMSYACGVLVLEHIRARRKGD